MKYTYHINLNERGEFYADVRDDNDTTVYEIRIPNEEGDNIFTDGYMRSITDTGGLEKYLRQIGIMQREDFLFMADDDKAQYKQGGSVPESTAMLLSQAKEVKHHADELKKVVVKTRPTEPWVLGKMERATTDLSDVTHYMDGKTEYAGGGGVGRLNKRQKKLLEYIKSTPTKWIEDINLSTQTKMELDDLVAMNYLSKEYIPRTQNAIYSMKYAEGGGVGVEGFTIEKMKEELKKMFPDSFGFSVNTQEGNPRDILAYKMDEPYYGLDDTQVAEKLHFPQYKRDHEINWKIKQGDENTYFDFLLESESGKYFIGHFGFKDRGDVSSDYITRFIVFLMKEYGLPFQVNHSVYEDGGGIDGDDYIDPIATARISAERSIDWDRELRKYAGSNYDKLTRAEREEIISELIREWNRRHSYRRGGGISKRTNYLSKRDISAIVTDNGTVIKGNDLVDGAYVKRRVKFNGGGYVLSNNMKMSDIVWQDNTDYTHGRYDFAFETFDAKGSPVMDYDGYIILSAPESRMPDEIAWGLNTPEDWEKAEQFIIESFYDWKQNQTSNKKYDNGGNMENTPAQFIRNLNLSAFNADAAEMIRNEILNDPHLDDLKEDDEFFVKFKNYVTSSVPKALEKAPEGVAAPTAPAEAAGKPSKKILEIQLRIANKMLQENPDNKLAKTKKKILENLIANYAEGGGMYKNGGGVNGFNEYGPYQNKPEWSLIGKMVKITNDDDENGMFGEVGKVVNIIEPSEQQKKTGRIRVFYAINFEPVDEKGEQIIAYLREEFRVLNDNNKYVGGGGVGKMITYEVDFYGGAEDFDESGYAMSEGAETIAFQAQSDKAAIKYALDKYTDVYSIVNTATKQTIYEDGKAKLKLGGGVGSNRNAEYLNSLSEAERMNILNNIANHYGMSVQNAENEVTDSEAEMLYEYITDSALRMKVYRQMESGMYNDGGGLGQLTTQTYSGTGSLTPYQKGRISDIQLYTAPNGTNVEFVSMTDPDSSTGMVYAIMINGRGLWSTTDRKEGIDFYREEIERYKMTYKDGGSMSKMPKPKVIRTIFEEEEFEYAGGGGVGKKKHQNLDKENERLELTTRVSIALREGYKYMVYSIHFKPQPERYEIKVMWYKKIKDAENQFKDLMKGNYDVTLYALDESYSNMLKEVKQYLSTDSNDTYQFTDGKTIVELVLNDDEDSKRGWKEQRVVEGKKPKGFGERDYLTNLFPVEIAQRLSENYGGTWEVITTPDAFAKGGGIKNKPKMVRTVFEEEEFEYAKGGKIQLGDMVHIPVINRSGVVMNVLENGKFYSVRFSDGSKMVYSKADVKKVSSGDEYGEGGGMDSLDYDEYLKKKVEFWLNKYNYSLENSYYHAMADLAKAVRGQFDKVQIDQLTSSDDNIRNAWVDFKRYWLVKPNAQGDKYLVENFRMPSFAGGGGMDSNWVVEFHSHVDGGTKVVRVNAKDREDAVYKGWRELTEDGEYSEEYSVSYVHKSKYAEGGGMATFDDKVNAISKRLEGTNVKPKYQKQYGKKYSKGEAKEAATKIAGAMRAKENK